MSDTIVLEVRQDLDNDGWEDGNGAVHYDDRVITPYGDLSSLRVAHEDGVPLIVDAPEVALIRHGFPTLWSAEHVQGVSIDTTFAGVQVFTLEASNGKVRYQLDPRPVRWSDQDEPVPFYLGIRVYSDYIAPKHIAPKVTTTKRVVRHIKEEEQ